MFITRIQMKDSMLPSKEEAQRKDSCQSHADSVGDVLPKRETSMQDMGDDVAKEARVCEWIYRFDHLSQLLQGCHYLCAYREKNMHHGITSRAYRDDHDAFYLVIKFAAYKGKREGQQAGTSYSYLLGEVGTPIQSTIAHAYIAEHAQLLCADHAVEILGKL